MNERQDGIWLRVAGAIISGGLTIAVGLITHTLYGIDEHFAKIEAASNERNSRLVRMEAWKDSMISENSVPRTELDLRDKVIAAQMQQLDLKIQELQRTRK